MAHITVTREQLIGFKPCELQERLKRWPDTASTMDIRQAFAAGFTVSDVLWIAGKLGLGIDCARVAVFAAQQVANLNTDKRVQAAIDAAQNYIDSPSAALAARAARAADAACLIYAAPDACADNAAACAARAAAYAADTAAYTADAATYAAYAACAVDAAAYAAARATYSAARAARAARAATDTIAAADAAIRQFMVALWSN